VREQATPPAKPLRVPTGKTITAEGWGTRLDVRHGLLRVSDGQDVDDTEPVLLPRSRAKGLRIIVLGRAGTISVEALRWIADAGTVFALIDAAAGRVVCSSVDVGLSDARIRRAQALAGVPPSSLGLEIARYLIGRKIAGELWVLENDFADREREAEQLRDALGALPEATTANKIASIESACAAAYWSCFPDVELRFARKDEVRVPTHWRRFGTRASAITGSPRLASNPANAALNYLNALAEVECRVALLTLGADPALGVLHRDTPSRDSFALDLIEVVRPWIESFLLDLVQSRVFSKSDFYETERGVFRVGSALARQLAQTMPAWRKLVAPHAEHVVELVASSAPGRIRIPSKLTQSNRSAGRDSYRKSDRQARTRERVAERMVPRRCRECGVEISGRRALCPDCLLQVRKDELSRAGDMAVRTLQALRAEGVDPSHGGKAASKRAQTLARHREETKAFEAATGDPPSHEVFVRQILPALQSVPVRAMAEATSLTRSYCSMIRRGRIPHARHWPALSALARDAAGKPMKDSDL
jgi:CRISPR-associated endonuclease Cas1